MSQIPTLADARLESRFADAKPRYTWAEALVEANRCLYCHDAPCITACPTSIDIPRFIKQIATNDLRGSARTILSSNMLGVSCARVCPVEVLCAGACVYNGLNHQPIAIGRLQRYATETAIAAERAGGPKLFTPAPPTGKKVALVGAGPASLACAAHLALAGIQPTLFERAGEPGGLNTSGVAPYKLPAAAALDEVAWLLDFGVDLRLGVTVGVDISFADLQAQYDAVFIGVGLGLDRMLDYRACKNVWGATALIRALKLQGGFALPKDLRNALVIGGGNTAIDIARELAMLGVPEVWLVYRKTEREMSGYAHEWVVARQYGVKMEPNCHPSTYSMPDDKITYARFDRGSQPQLSIECDFLVVATGQEDWARNLGADLALNPDGTVVVDPVTLQTSLPGVYAGGDCVNGGKEVVNAAAHGREAAKAIAAALSA